MLAFAVTFMFPVVIVLSIWHVQLYRRVDALAVDLDYLDEDARSLRGFVGELSADQGGTARDVGQVEDAAADALKRIKAIEAKLRAADVNFDAVWARLDGSRDEGERAGSDLHCAATSAGDAAQGLKALAGALHTLAYRFEGRPTEADVSDLLEAAGAAVDDDLGGDGFDG